MWYDLNKTLSHNAFINIVIGSRGTGKTYALKNKALNNYLKKGEQFIYLRRYKEESKRIRNSLFADLNRDTGYNVEYSPRENAYTLDNNVKEMTMAFCEQYTNSKNRAK